MKVKDYQCVAATSPQALNKQIKGLIKRGYELYGPPMVQQTQTLAAYKANGIVSPYSENPDRTYVQVMVLPVIAVSRSAGVAK